MSGLEIVGVVDVLAAELTDALAYEFVVTITSLTLDLDLDVIDSFGGLVLGATSSNGALASVSFTATATADFLIRIHDPGAYTLVVDSDSDDVLTGDGGPDMLFGGAGDATISGLGGSGDLVYGDRGAGDDIFVLSGGNDTVFGGADNDTIVFLDGFGVDVVIDFASGEDKINLSLLSTLTTPSDGDIVETGFGVGIFAQSDPANLIVLEGLGIGDLAASDFVL